jgi:hypothetical protein
VERWSGDAIPRGETWTASPMGGGESPHEGTTWQAHEDPSSVRSPTRGASTRDDVGGVPPLRHGGRHAEHGVLNCILVFSSLLVLFGFWKKRMEEAQMEEATKGSLNSQGRGRGEVHAEMAS